ncbi:MAG: flagellar filament capping protein FliD [Oscillospiraceae bacterium]
MAINSLTPESHGFSGMVSGMDTQAMVEKMLSGTQTKIDMKTQQKAVLAYKQGMYRDMATRLKTFQSTFFSFTNNATNLLSNSFYKTMTANSTSKFFKAQATTDAAAGKFTVNSIEKLATTHKETASVKASGKLEGEFSAAKLEELKNVITDDKNAITIRVGEGADQKSVKINAGNLVGKSNEQVAAEIQKALTDGNANAKVEYLNGKMQIFATDGKSTVSVNGSDESNVMFGDMKSGTGGATFTFDSSKMLPSYNLTLDGISKNITINPITNNADGTFGTVGINEIAAQLSQGAQNAFGAGISVTANQGKITFNVTNPTSKLTVNAEKEVMDTLGIKQGQSNKVLTNAALKDINFDKAITGNIQKFKINGVDFSFDSSNSLTDIIADINTSKAGVKISYDSYSDKFSIESKSQGTLATGAGNAFTMSQTEGNLLTSMFGVKASGNYSSMPLSNAAEQTASFDKATFNFAGGDVSINVNGVKKTYTLAATTDAKALVDELNTKLKKDFPAKETINGVETESALVKFELNAAGDGVSITSLDAEVQKTISVDGNGLKALGFSQVVDGNTKMSELGFEDFKYTANGVDINVSKNATLDEFLAQLSTASGGKAELTAMGQQPFIRIAGVSIPMTFPPAVSDSLFGANVDEQGAADAVINVEEAGQNALATINGKQIERSSNTFMVDGVNITLTATTTEAEDVTITQDTDKIFDTVKKFVEEYNKLTDDINELLKAEVTHKDYAPLTAAQKAAMSDKEIEAWEAKSKGGLLRGDSTLTNVLSNLRSTLYTKPENATTLYQLGITTNDYYGKKDNLAIDDEADLKAKIAANPEAIAKLFTDAENGLGTLMNNAIDKAAKPTGSPPGSLVSMAGAKGFPDNDSTIAKQMKLIDDSITSLNNKYASEYDRYWKQYNNMEMMLQKMNSQSSWMAQQFAG